MSLFTRKPRKIKSIIPPPERRSVVGPDFNPNVLTYSEGDSDETDTRVISTIPLDYTGLE